jgi:DNA helicase-2/ATP-dependent DNA helicase PcrA
MEHAAFGLALRLAIHIVCRGDEMARRHAAHMPFTVGDRAVALGEGLHHVQSVRAFRRPDTIGCHGFGRAATAIFHHAPGLGVAGPEPHGIECRGCIGEGVAGRGCVAAGQGRQEAGKQGGVRAHGRLGHLSGGGGVAYMAAVHAEPDYLTRLNEAQRQAVETVDGPLLVLAGAGTGKTRVLTTRFAHILLTGKAAPGQILAVTFTNKAAREMRDRVSSLLGRPVEGLWLGTFHALCARMLRRHAEHVGLRPSFSILDTDDQLRLLKQVMETLRIDAKRWAPAAVMGVLQRWKDRGQTPDRVPAAEAAEFCGGRVVEVYAAYQTRLRELNAADFGDLMLHMTEIMRAQPDVLAQYHRMFRYVLVDEYQDTNVVQYLWLRLLAQQSKNICCVGDDDQSIYSWRGAEVENILRFEKDFPGATIVRLESNYRSTAPILAAASALIANNEGRLGKTLRVGRQDQAGDKVSVVSLWDTDEEARMVGERVEGLRRDGHKLAEMAILVRAGHQTRSFEERMITLGLPYRVVGGLRFYERAEIRDAIAYARVMSQPADDLAFERIVNVPKRGIGEGAMRDLHDVARAQSVPLAVAAMGMIKGGGLRGRMRESLAALMAGFVRWRDMLETEGHVATVATMLDESGYIAMWEADKSPEAPGRVENLKEFVRALADFETLGGFLEHVSLVMENEESAGTDRISLMTMHAAKGLEFDTVFLPGWEEGLFPSQRSMDENGTKGLEEERRLAYVGLTRARRRAVVSYAANRRIYANWQRSIPSRFVEELPDDHVERVGSTALARESRLMSPSVFLGGPVMARRPKTMEAWEQPGRPARPDTVPVGQRVFHQKFGYGVVTASEDDRLDISFEKAGQKRVLDRFVEKA